MLHFNYCIKNISCLVRVPKNARRYVYCLGLRNGTAEDYTFLYGIYNTSQNAADMVVILRTLACTKHEESIAQ